MLAKPAFTVRDEALSDVFGERPGSLDELLTRLPLDVSTPAMDGGSNATIYPFEHAGRGYVVKFVRAGTELVDGHDAITLAWKAEQIDLIRRQCPQLAHHLVVPASVYSGDDGCAIVMPHRAGTALVEMLKNAEGPEAFFEKLSPILATLIEHGYMTSVIAAARGTFARLHVDRVERRLDVMRARFDPDLLDGRLRINGSRCPRVEDLLADLRSRPKLLEALDPPKLHFPVHGDLNIDNVFRREPGTGEGTWYMLDPRGTVEHWDAIYDLGKLLFSLAGLHNGMRSGFWIRRTPGAIEVGVHAGQTAAFEAAADEFPQFLLGVPGFGNLIEGDPNWLLRLHMTTAMHMLAEVACRFSDTKTRTTMGNRGEAARIELATGLYTMGMLSMVHLLQFDDRPDHGAPLKRPNWQFPC